VVAAAKPPRGRHASTAAEPAGHSPLNPLFQVC
jgi:hypothetical protein